MHGPAAFLHLGLHAECLHIYNSCKKHPSDSLLCSGEQTLQESAGVLHCPPTTLTTVTPSHNYSRIHLSFLCADAEEKMVHAY